MFTTLFSRLASWQHDRKIRQASQLEKEERQNLDRELIRVWGEISTYLESYQRTISLVLTNIFSRQVLLSSTGASYRERTDAEKAYGKLESCLTEIQKWLAVPRTDNPQVIAEQLCALSLDLQEWKCIQNRYNSAGLINDLEFLEIARVRLKLSSLCQSALSQFKETISSLS